MAASRLKEGSFPQPEAVSARTRWPRNEPILKGSLNRCFPSTRKLRMARRLAKGERRPRAGPPNPLPSRQEAVQAAQGQMRDIQTSAESRGPLRRSPRASPHSAPTWAAFAVTWRRRGGRCGHSKLHLSSVKACPRSCHPVPPAFSVLMCPPPSETNEGRGS